MQSEKALDFGCVVDSKKNKSLNSVVLKSFRSKISHEFRISLIERGDFHAGKQLFIQIYHFFQTFLSFSSMVRAFLVFFRFHLTERAFE